MRLFDMFEDDIPPMPKKTVAKTWDQMTPQEKISGVKGRTVWNDETRKYRTVFDVPAEDKLDEIKKGQKDSNGYTKCRTGWHADGTKPSPTDGKPVRNCVANEGAEFGATYAEQLAQKVFNVRPALKNDDDVLTIGYKVAVQDLMSQTRAVSLFSRDQDFPSDYVSAYYYLQKQGGAEGSLREFAPGSSGGSNSGRWYTDDELADIIGDDWFEDFDVSNDGFNIDAYGEKAKKNLVGYANAWFDDKGYNVNVMGVEHNDVDHDLQWYIVGSFHNPGFADKGGAEGLDEFARGSGDNDSNEDPYKYPKPEHYSRSVDFFGQFEADHFDKQDMNDTSGEFKGYWGKDQIAYFKFDNPKRTGSDDPGMGWYYEPTANGNDSSTSVNPGVDNSAQRKQQEMSMINAFLKSGQTAKPGSQIYSLMKKHSLAEGSDTVDSLVTDAEAIMKKFQIDAEQALKTVLGNREYNSRRGYYNFYIRQIIARSGQQGVAEDFNGEYDDEVGMVKNNIHTIVRVLTHLSKDIGGNENLPEWVQEKIAMIKQTSVEVMNYMISQHEMGVAPSVTDEATNYHANRIGFNKHGRDLSGEDEPTGMFMVMIDGRPWKEFTSNMAFARAKAFATRNPDRNVQVRWPTGQLNTVKEDSWHGTGDAWHGGAQGEV